MLRKSAAVLPGAALDALGNPERRRLVEALAESPSSVTDLAARVPISRPAVSRHLKQLEQAGLVVHRSEGTRNIYSLDPTGLDHTTTWLNAFWDEAAARLRLLAENTRSDGRPSRG